MGIFGKSKKTEKLDCTIKETVEHCCGETYTLANYKNGHSSFDFAVTEIVHLDDDHKSCLEGRGKTGDFYLPLDPLVRTDSSLAIKEFEFRINIETDPSKCVQDVLGRYNLDNEKLFTDYNTNIHDNGIAFLNLHEFSLSLQCLTLELYLKDEIYQKIHSAIKNGSLSRMEFQLSFFDLYRLNSNKDILYIEDRYDDKAYRSHGLFKNLIIETHKTIIS